MGTAYVALVNLCFARSPQGDGGKFVLRIEDTDRARSTPESETAILDSLRWLGLNWDEGPIRQSERSQIYQEHVARLLDEGHAFRCFCTAERLEDMRVAQRAAKQPPHYDGHCLNLSASEIEKNMAGGVPYVVRMKVPQSGSCVFEDVLRGRIEIEWKSVDMQVLMKSDGLPTYHLANVVDDHLMGITHVIRGEEWISSAPKHMLLYSYFGWDAPRLCHLPLLRNPDKSKLSKRKNPTSILYYRERGYLAESLLHFLGLLLDSRNGDSLVESCRTTADLIAAMSSHFELERIALGGPVFDTSKLDWLNGQHIRTHTVDEFEQMLLDFGYVWPNAIPAEMRSHIARVAQPRIATLADFAPLVAFFADRPKLSKAELALPKLSEEQSRAALMYAEQQLLQLDEDASSWTQAAIGEKLKAAAQQGEWKFKDVARLYYVAVTGSPTSVPLFDAMEILGKVESLRRLRIALEALR